MRAVDSLAQFGSGPVPSPARRLEMRLTRAARALAVAATFPLFVPAIRSAQAQSDTWALVNARIQTVSHGAIDKGTIIIRKGLIEAVGPTVPVPADARGLDLEAAKELRVPPSDVKPLRDLGITAVLVAPSRGLFRGMSALVPLRDSVDATAIVREP